MFTLYVWLSCVVKNINTLNAKCITPVPLLPDTSALATSARCIFLYTPGLAKFRTAVYVTEHPYEILGARINTLV